MLYRIDKIFSRINNTFIHIKKIENKLILKLNFKNPVCNLLDSDFSQHLSNYEMENKLIKKELYNS